MASSTDTNVSSFIVNEVASDDVLKQMESAGQIQPNQYYMTPDETDDTFMPVGMVFQSAIPIDDARVHLLDGSTVAISGIYADFVNYLKQQKAKGYDLYYTYSGDYDTVLALYEQCGKFLVDEANGILRFPTVRFFTEGVRNLSQICQVLDAGIPNITGNIDWVVSYTGGCGGAFYNTANNNSNSGGGQSVARDFKFDASRGETKTYGTIRNDVYGKSDTVQPQAVRYPYYIVVASGYKSTQQVNFDNIANEVNPLKKRYVTETWKSGYNWYTKYSDGWKECGGYATVDGRVTFPIAFTDTYYTLVGGLIPGLKSATWEHLNMSNQTTTGFNFEKHDDYTLKWYACGY